MEVKWIDIALLRPNDYNPNRLSNEEFKGLVESILSAGFCEQNPILTRPIDGYFEIVDGEHRWKACLELKIEKIPAIVRQMDDLEAHKLCVILNKDRGTPDYFKLSKLFNKDLERGLQQKDLARHFGFTKSIVSEILKIYPRLAYIISSDIQTFTNWDLIFLARVESNYLRQELVKRAGEGNWSSNKIQDKASLCNKALVYLQNKTEDEKLIFQILEELVDSFFTYPESTLINEIELKFKELLAQRIIQGDAFEEMMKLEAESIDLLVTDPPYNISDPSKLTKKGGEIVELDIADWDKQTEEEYEQFILRLLECIKRVLKPSGSFYIFLDKAFSSVAWKMCKQIGLKPKNIVHWRKTNPVPHARKKQLHLSG